jgi:hypothetical protein
LRVEVSMSLVVDAALRLVMSTTVVVVLRRCSGTAPPIGQWCEGSNQDKVSDLKASLPETLRGRRSVSSTWRSLKEIIVAQ